MKTDIEPNVIANVVTIVAINVAQVVETDIESNVAANLAQVVGTDIAVNETEVRNKNITMRKLIICIIIFILWLIPLTIYYSRPTDDIISVCLLFLISLGYVELSLMILILLCIYITKPYNNIEENPYIIYFIIWLSRFISVAYVFMNIITIAVLILRTTALNKYNSVIIGYLIFITFITLLSWIIILCLITHLCTKQICRHD